jgi:hypothetical protein
VCLESQERQAVCLESQERQAVCLESQERQAMCLESQERQAVCLESQERQAVYLESQEIALGFDSWGIGFGKLESFSDFLRRGFDEPWLLPRPRPPRGGGSDLR